MSTCQMDLQIMIKNTAMELILQLVLQGGGSLDARNNLQLSVMELAQTRLCSMEIVIDLTPHNIS